jgi:acetyltransferase-like isoleucine patch superfamily enzyme
MINPEHSIFYIAKNAVFFFLYGCVKYFPSPIGDYFRYLVLKIFLKKIKTMWIKDGATFWFPDKISIGKNTSINEFVVINGAGNVEIGDNVLIGHRTTIASDSHGIDDINIEIYRQPKTKKPIKIGDNVFLGCNVTVLPGVTIGSGAVIGAGAVVTEDVSANAVVVGNPAKILRFRGTR